MQTRYTAKQRELLIEWVRKAGKPVNTVATRMGVSESMGYLWMKTRAGAGRASVREIGACAARCADATRRVGGWVASISGGPRISRRVAARGGLGAE
jgi:hypothetical protein